MKLKLLALQMIVILIAGCAEFSAFKSGVAEHGADVTDEALESSVWYTCNAASVGAVKRRFKTPEERKAYNAICQDQLP